MRHILGARTVGRMDRVCWVVVVVNCEELNGDLRGFNEDLMGLLFVWTYMWQWCTRRIDVPTRLVWFYADGRVYYYCTLTHTHSHSPTHAPHLVSHPSFNWMEGGATSETEEPHYLTTREKSNLLPTIACHSTIRTTPKYHTPNDSHIYLPPL